jgi:hypothetical protein
LYLEHGYCYSEPSMLALARPCHTDHYEKWVERDDANAWWVQLVIGPNAMATLLTKLPFPLPFIGWSRDFKGRPMPRFYQLDRLLQHI